MPRRAAHLAPGAVGTRKKRGCTRPVARPRVTVHFDPLTSRHQCRHDGRRPETRGAHKRIHSTGGEDARTIPGREGPGYTYGTQRTMSVHSLPFRIHMDWWWGVAVSWPVSRAGVAPAPRNVLLWPAGARARGSGLVHGRHARRLRPIRRRPGAPERRCTKKHKAAHHNSKRALQGLLYQGLEHLETVCGDQKTLCGGMKLLGGQPRHLDMD